MSFLHEKWSNEKIIRMYKAAVSYSWLPLLNINNSAKRHVLAQGNFDLLGSGLKNMFPSSSQVYAQNFSDDHQFILGFFGPITATIQTTNCAANGR